MMVDSNIYLCFHRQVVHNYLDYHIVLYLGKILLIYKQAMFLMNMVIARELTFHSILIKDMENRLDSFVPDRIRMVLFQLDKVV